MADGEVCLAKGPRPVLEASGLLREEGISGGVGDEAVEDRVSRVVWRDIVMLHLAFACQSRDRQAASSIPAFRNRYGAGR